MEKKLKCKILVTLMEKNNTGGNIYSPWLKTAL